MCAPLSGQTDLLSGINDIELKEVKNENDELQKLVANMVEEQDRISQENASFNSEIQRLQ